MRKIIIDCDPGVDDAIAIFMALASEKLDVLGITTVAGNVGIEQVTYNARALVSMAGTSLPVCRGLTSSRLNACPDGGHSHGGNGVGNITLPEPTFEEDRRDAVQFIDAMANRYPGELELVTIGPLTNIATALHLHPELSSNIKRIIMMGGAAGFGTNGAEVEFNMSVDPDSAATVFQCGIPIDMYGLDVTNRAVITAEEIAILRDTGRTVPVTCCAMLATYADFSCGLASQGPALHDPLAVAGAIDESLVEFGRYHVAVETENPATRGTTVVDDRSTPAARPQTRVAQELDRVRFIAMLIELLRSY